jgi:hypothetical protein
MNINLPDFEPRSGRNEKEVLNKINACIYSTSKYIIYADLVDFISVFRYGEGAFAWDKNRELYDELLQIMHAAKGEIDIVQYFSKWDDLRRHLKYMVGKLLQRGLCRVWHWEEKRYVHKIKVIEGYDVIGPNMGGGGRQFYIGDDYLFYLNDWYT